MIVCGECGEEYHSDLAEWLMTFHLKQTGHCQGNWQHNGKTQRDLEHQFEDSLTREDVDLLREYKVKV